MFSEVSYSCFNTSSLKLSTMHISTFDRYSLKQSDVPKIIKKTIVEDVNVGGIKLRYEVSTVIALVFYLFKKQKIVPLRTLPKTTIMRTFLNPYKSIWDVSRNKLPKCLWGNNQEPLTKLWIELEVDYKDIKSGTLLLKQEIRDTNITKHLSKIRELFYILKK